MDTRHNITGGDGRGTVDDDGKHAGHNGNLYGKQVEKLMSAR
jgi:hypothetical protein